MYVFAFDRDHTVDVSPHPDKETVPLEWVKYLAHDSDHEVWAMGNQDLKEEAGIPGLVEAMQRLENEWYEKLGDTIEDKWYDDFPSREERLGMLEELFPDAEYIVVDDADLSHVEGWQHYYSWDFVDAVREGETDFGIPQKIH